MEKVWNNIYIKFTSNILPAPHCYILEATINRGSNSIDVNTSINYTHRTGFTQNELEEEGYSSNDNQSASSTLAGNWLYFIDQQVKEPIIEILQTQEENISVTVKFNDNTTELVEENKYWVYILQCLFQGVIENERLENTLEIEYIDYKSKIAVIQYQIQYFFATLEVKIVEIKEGQEKSWKIDWKQGQNFLQKIFQLDYDPQNGLEYIAKKEGEFLNPGQGIWYNIKNLKSWNKKFKGTVSIKQYLEELAPG